MAVNMSYCRFENTLAALRECWESDGMSTPEDLNDYEKKARIRLIGLCKDIAEDNEESDD